LSGIGAQRLQLEWLSSAEAQRFAEIALRVTDTIRALGPLDPSASALPLAAAELTLGGEPLRWLVGKEHKIVSHGDVYGRPWDTQRFRTVMDEMLEREYHKNLIYLAIREGASAVRPIAARTGLPLRRISHLLADLEKTNRVEFKGMQDKKPVFAALA
jgi:hypothetical protein